MDFSDYRLDAEFHDEVLQPDGTPRAHCRALYDLLAETSGVELGDVQERVTRSFLNEGITFTVYGDGEADERIIPIDCLPRILAAAEWREIEAGLAQRILALNRFLCDVYGDCRAIADGVIPEEMVRGCPQYRPQMRGVSPPHGTWVAICGTDVVRTNDGFIVLEDNLRVPSGVSYMIANRKAVKSSLRRLYRRCRVQEVEHYGDLLLATLRELAPPNRPDPCIALLTPGVWNAAFYEHMFLARELGAELVEGRDLLTRNGFVYMRTTEGLRQVDVIYRRVDDDFLDPRVFRPDSLLGVPGLLQSHRLGNVTLANAPGTGVADDKSVYAYVPDLIRYYLSEEPILANVPTRICRRPEELEYTLPRHAHREARWRGGRVRHARGPPGHAGRARGLCRGDAGQSGRLHLAGGIVALTGSLPDRRAARAAARRPAPVRAPGPGDPHRAGRFLPRGASPGQHRGELEPGRRRQGRVGAGFLTCWRAARRVCTGWAATSSGRKTSAVSCASRWTRSWTVRCARSTSGGVGSTTPCTGVRPAPPSGSRRAMTTTRWPIRTRWPTTSPSSARTRARS